MKLLSLIVSATLAVTVAALPAAPEAQGTMETRGNPDGYGAACKFSDRNCKSGLTCKPDPRCIGVLVCQQYGRCY